MLITNK